MKKTLVLDYIKKILIILSGTCLSACLSLKGQEINRIIGIIVAAVFLSILAFNKKTSGLFSISDNTALICLSLLFSIVTSYCFQNRLITFLYDQYGISIIRFYSIEYYILLFAPLYFLLIWYQYFIGKLSEIIQLIYRDSKKYEKILFVIFVVVFSVAGLVIFLNTTIFTSCTSTEGWNFPYDVLYTTDSAAMIRTDVYMNVNAGSNNIRQMLFGVFSIPFVIIPRIISKLLSFALNEKFVYVYLVFVVQVVLAQISIILIVRLINANMFKSILLITFFNTTYCILLFSFVAEQYIVSIFWMIIYIYIYMPITTSWIYFYQLQQQVLFYLI